MMVDLTFSTIEAGTAPALDDGVGTLATLVSKLPGSKGLASSILWILYASLQPYPLTSCLCAG